MEQTPDRLLPLPPLDFKLLHPVMLWVYGLGFRVGVLDFKLLRPVMLWVYGLGFRIDFKLLHPVMLWVYGLGFRVWGVDLPQSASPCHVVGSRLRVWGAANPRVVLIRHVQITGFRPQV